MTNTTITDNRTDSDDSGSEDGGGVYVDAGTVTLHNTIVSSNVRGSAAPVADDVSGTLEVGSSYNLIGDAGSGGGLTDGVNGNIVGADPLLGPLDYYYYHSPTRTYPLLSSSPALDTGSNSRANDAGLTTDQRGVDRFYDGDDNGTATVDIGAYEFYVFPGDWDGDGFVEGDDIDELFDNFGNPQYDLDGDGETDTDDVGYVLHDVLNTEWGDANLDGKVNVGDLGIFASNYGSSGLGWGGGDYTGDGTINVGDLGILAANYGFETSPGGGAAGGGIVGVGGGTFVVTETPILDVSVFPPAEVYVAPPAEVDTVISPDPQGQDSSNPDPSVELLTILLLGVLPPI